MKNMEKPPVSPRPQFSHFPRLDSSLFMIFRASSLKGGLLVIFILQ